MYRVFLKASATAMLCGMLLNPAQAVEVYLFKGAGDFSFINKNLHFSRGLERIAEQLNQEGIHAEVRGFAGVEDALGTIRRRRPESVAFIGHSMGALASLGLARQMRSEGIRVAYLGLIDIPGPVGTAGDNVEWAENYYSIHPVYGKLTNTRSHPNARNIHVFGQIHTTMDDSKKVREGMISALRQVQAAEMRQQQGSEVLQANSDQNWQATIQPVPAQDPMVIQHQEQPDQTQIYHSNASQEWASGGDGQEPYVLPGPGQSGTYQQVVQPDQPSQSYAATGTQLDQTTTSSTTAGRIVETGKNLFSKAVGYVNRVGSSGGGGVKRRPVER